MNKAKIKRHQKRLFPDGRFNYLRRLKRKSLSHFRNRMKFRNVVNNEYD
jgi:hypothetical protein